MDGWCRGSRRESTQPEVKAGVGVLDLQGQVQKSTRLRSGLKLGQQSVTAPSISFKAGTTEFLTVSVMMYRSDSSTVGTFMDWLTWSRLGSVQVGEALVGWAEVTAAERRLLRVCSTARGRPPLARLVQQSTSTSTRKHLRNQISTVKQHESISREV